MLKSIFERAAGLARRHEALLARLAVFGGAAGLAVLFLLFGPPHLIVATETPAFCGMCHSMKGQHRDWSHSGHRAAKCIDCHLPNSNPVSHYFWKAIDGNKDVFYEFTGLREHDEIKLSKHAWSVLRENCERCHAAAADRMDPRRACTDCHRAAGHKAQGMYETR